MPRSVISVIIAVLAIVIIAVIVFFWQQCTAESGWVQGSWVCGVCSGQQPSEPSPLGPCLSSSGSFTTLARHKLKKDTAYRCMAMGVHACRAASPRHEAGRVLVVLVALLKKPPISADQAQLSADALSNCRAAHGSVSLQGQTPPRIDRRACLVAPCPSDQVVDCPAGRTTLRL